MYESISILFDTKLKTLPHNFEQIFLLIYFPIYIYMYVYRQFPPTFAPALPLLKSIIFDRVCFVEYTKLFFVREKKLTVFKMAF